MNEQFVFVASCLCLLVGLVLCFLPARRYWKLANIGFAGALLLVFGVVLMTTFKWTEVAIKISGLEVKLAEAQQDANNVRNTLVAVQNAISPEAKKQTLEAVLTSYKNVSNTAPTPAQVTDFKQALDKANVTIVPAQIFKEIDQGTPKLAPKKW